MFLHAEFMYKPRPTDEQVRATFDANLRSRLGALSAADRVLMICDSAATIDSLKPLMGEFPHLPTEYAIANPHPRATQKDTPTRCAWETPDAWRQMDMSDRWARILVALRRAAEMGGDGYLIMPAHEAVYASGLFDTLIPLAEAKRRETGKWHAVSPIEAAPIRWQVRTARMPSLQTRFRRDGILAVRSRPHKSTMHDIFTAAFEREMLDGVCEGGQGFWGKMGMLPFAVGDELARVVDTDAWEDDLEIDRAMHELKHGTACVKVQRSLYHLQYGIPFFQTPDKVRETINRHLHYSLKIPGDKPSALHSAPSQRSLYRARTDAGYARALEAADALIAECDAEMRTRVARYGCSWVDWGAYRYVARPRDPAVEVWKRG
jgi:hypothetical protein